MININFNIPIDTSLPKISISEVLNYLETPFDREGVAEKTYNKHFNNPESQYYQKSIQEILEIWEAKGADSCHYGSLLDDYIGTILENGNLDEYKINNNYENDQRLHNLCDSFDNFYNIMMKSGDVEFIDREKDVYLKCCLDDPDNPEDDTEFYIRGRFDALFYNKRTNKWILIDWKSSGSIDKVPNRWTPKFLGPMSKFPALNYYRYTNQLHFYKKALLENYLPKGTSADDIIIMIVNLPGKIIEGTNQNYMIHLTGMEYDPTLLSNIFKFSMAKKLEENKQNNKVEEIDLENLF